MRLRIIIIFIFVLFFAGIVYSAEVLPVYNLSVSFDLQHNLLKGDALISFPEDGERNISVGELDIVSIKFNGNQLEPVLKEGILTITGQGILEILYEGTFKGEGEETGIEGIEKFGVVPKNIVSGGGISLTSSWYPSLVGMSLWNLQAVIPKGFKAISEAEKISITYNDQDTLYSFYFPYPLRRIHLVVGSYAEQCEGHEGIEICTYFFPEDAPLAGKCLEYTKKYLSLYGKLLGPYPYKHFSLAENILPAGYSMPTFTVLGRAVVNLPFILETSLRHEVLHQWFGNYVYTDLKSGNWIEGITSYLSDRLYEERKGIGWQQRKKILIDYQSYVTESKEALLKDFKERTDFASAAIDCGKGAMVFHMLNKLVGEKVFLKALQGLIREKKFAEVSWKDVEMEFEKAAGESLEWFFGQWLEKKGVPFLNIKNARIDVLKGVPTVLFEVIQKGQPYRLSLSVKVVTEKGEIRDVLQIEESKQEFQIPVDGKALRIIFDEDYDIMRELTDKEFPPLLARLFGDEEKLLVFPENEKEKEKYSKLIQIFSKEGFATIEEQKVKDKDISNSSLLVLGYESPVLRRFFGEVRRPKAGFTVVVRHNLLNDKKVIAYADGDSKEEIDPVAAKLFHYGEYSLLRFSGGENIEKKTDDSERGITMSLYQPVHGLNPKALIDLENIIKTIIDKPIIFVGERHTNYEDHKVQLEIIMELFQRQKKFAIGMEMFQRPFQRALDDYLSGAISEREFLKASEYFKRWKYNYNLYREIIEFAKAKGIPIVALNLKEEIVRKVAEGGLDTLTPEEKEEIPADMDMTSDEYRERVKRAFQFHGRSPLKNFEYFYQSQILWDETMAHSVAQFLNGHPDFQMVVLAGEQHVVFNSGIPKRTFRLTGKQYATLINGMPEEVDADVGNFVLFPEPLSLPALPKLGILIQEDEGKIRVKDLLPGSAAAQAGIEENDAIISVDDWKIESIEDVKIALFDKRVGETVTVKVLRKRFLRSDKEFKFQVTL